VVVCEDCGTEKEVAKDDDLLRVGVPPKDGTLPNVGSRAEFVVGDAANEKGVKALEVEVEPSEGASPLNSNGMVRQRTN
jgi:hypothetical protein